MTVIPTTTHVLVESKEDGPQIWSTSDESAWFVLWPQQPNGYLYVYQSNDEVDAQAKYAQTDQAGFTAYTVANMAGTAGPPATMCLLLESASDWFIALLPETPPQSFAWTDSGSDAADTYAAITDGWEF